MVCDPKEFAPLRDLGVPEEDIQEMVAAGLDLSKWVKLVMKMWPRIQGIIDDLKEAFGGTTGSGGVFGTPMMTPHVPAGQLQKVQALGLPTDAARINFGSFWKLIKKLIGLLGGGLGGVLGTTNV